MFVKVMLTCSFKIFLLSLIFSECFCQRKPSNKSTEKKKPELNCYCDSLKNLCEFSPVPDSRISNSPVEELKCDMNSYMYCDIEHKNLTQYCGIRKVRNGSDLFGSHPWLATIYKTDKTFVGHGALIKPQFVLTIAHSIAGLKEKEIELRFGEWDRTVGAACPETKEKVKTIQIHPEFKGSPKYFNDIAIIELENKISLVEHPPINIACIATKVPDAGTSCIVAGWGKSDFNFEEIPDQLQQTSIPIVDSKACENRLAATRLGHKFKLDRDNFICAGGELGVDSCTKDGGSPLLCENEAGQYEIVGLVSWGVGCGSKIPGVYVNIPKFRDWIWKQVFELST